jgi:hypothetical protein
VERTPVQQIFLLQLNVFLCQIINEHFSKKKKEWAIDKGEQILQCGKGYNEMY